MCSIVQCIRDVVVSEGDFLHLEAKRLRVQDCRASIHFIDIVKKTQHSSQAQFTLAPLPVASIVEDLHLSTRRSKGMAEEAYASQVVVLAANVDQGVPEREHFRIEERSVPTALAEKDCIAVKVSRFQVVPLPPSIPTPARL